MAELNTTKLNPDTHLLLDQPLLRLPHELIRRNFKNTQRYLDREREHILPTLKETARNVDPQDPTETLKSLDAMLARMQTLKRKLENLHTEEQVLHDHSSKRIRHLQELYEIPALTDVKYENWSRTRLDRLMVDYLLRTGHSETATLLAESKGISDLIDLDTYISCHKIAQSIQRGETKDALTWINENRNALKKLITTTPTSDSGKPPSQVQSTQQSTISTLEFELRLQQFIEFLRQIPSQPSKRYDALSHAQKHLTPHLSSRTSQLNIASGLLAQNPDSPADPYQPYFSPLRWQYLSELFVETHHQLLNLPTRPLLHVALSAGLSALKTPACHSAYNPASSSTPGHAKIAMTSNNTSLCPICSTELNELARSVPYAHHTKSYVENNAVVLPNGRIYGRERLEELQRKMLRSAGGASLGNGDDVIGKDGSEVKDPTTGETYLWEQVKKVYIT